MRKIVFVNLWEPLPGNTNGDRLYRAGSIYTIINEKYGISSEYLTSSYNHIKKAYRRNEIKNRHNIKYLIATPYKKNMGILRVFSQFIASIHFFIWLLLKGKNKIIVISVPTIENLFVACLLKNVKLLTIIADVRDNWPQSFVEVGQLKAKIGIEVIYTLYHQFSKYSYRRCDKIITVSDTYKNWLVNTYNANDVSVLYHCKKQQSCIGEDVLITRSSRFQRTAIFSGTLGNTYDIKNFCECVTKNQDKLLSLGLRIVIAGMGPDLKNLKERYESQLLQFIGWVEADTLEELIKTSIIGLNLYKKDSPQSVGNKFGEYALNGLIILNTAIGEQSELVNIYNCGFNLNLNNECKFSYSEALISILSLSREQLLVMQRNSLLMHSALFNYEINYKTRYLDIISKFMKA